MGRARGAVVFSTRIWLVLPFLEQLVSFCSSHEFYLGIVLGLLLWAIAWYIRSKVGNHRSGCESRRRDVGRGEQPYLNVLGDLLVGKFQGVLGAVSRGVIDIQVKSCLVG